MDNKLQNQMCDLETGICGPVEEEETGLIDFGQPNKTITLYYVTDPICSHCWALEPVLRRFVEQYGSYFKFQTVMGGLLEKWNDGPIDPANGIYKPSDVAGHWREVGEYSRMPIDGSLMIDNPVQSSYPPSRVFKVIQSQINEEKANEYMRRAREALFVFNQNISSDAVLIEIVNGMGLDGEAIIQKSAEPSAKQALNEDFALARSLGARGFPSIILVNEDMKGAKIVGGQPLEKYVDGLQRLLGDVPQAKHQPLLADLLKKEQLLFSKEIEVMYEVDQEQIAVFAEKELSGQSYETKEILGERYYTFTKNEGL